MTVQIGTLVLEQLTHVSIREQTRLVRHPVPGLDGDFIQTLGRSAVGVYFEGIFYGETAAADLDQLRQAHLAQTPVDFFTEAVGEGYFTQVVIAQLAVSQRVQFPNQFDFACEVIEYVEPPAPAIANPLADIDADLTGEAAAFMDGVQNSLEQVAQLTNLATNLPNFGNPTEDLNQLLGDFTGATGDAGSALGAIQTLLAGDG